VVFDSTSVCIKDKTTGEVLLRASTIGSVSSLCLPIAHSILAYVALNSFGDQWHHRLGQCGARVLDALGKHKHL